MQCCFYFFILENQEKYWKIYWKILELIVEILMATLVDLFVPIYDVVATADIRKEAYDYYFTKRIDHNAHAI